MTTSTPRKAALSNEMYAFIAYQFNHALTCKLLGMDLILRFQIVHLCVQVASASSLSDPVTRMFINSESNASINMHCRESHDDYNMSSPTHSEQVLSSPRKNSGSKFAHNSESPSPRKDTRGSSKRMPPISEDNESAYTCHSVINELLI